MKEVFKDIPNYKGYYQVSNLGNVKSLDRVITYKNNKKRLWKGQSLKPMTQKNGYLTVSLYKNKKLKVRYIHQLVAETFLGHKVCREYHIDHIDNKKNNNRLDNLQILSHRKNISKTNKISSSKYTGVHYVKNRKGTKLWKAEISINKVKHSKYFYSEKEASLFYQNKLKTLQS